MHSEAYLMKHLVNFRTYLFCNNELFYRIFLTVLFGQILFSGWAISFCRWAVAHPVNMLRLGLSLARRFTQDTSLKSNKLQK